MSVKVGTSGLQPPRLFLKQSYQKLPIAKNLINVSYIKHKMPRAVKEQELDLKRHMNEQNKAKKN